MSASEQTHADHKKPLPLEISQAVQEVRAFYELGRRSRDEDAIRIKHGDHDKAAAKLGVGGEDLRKARFFADPKKGYSEKELEDLCQEMFRSSAIIGVSMVKVLLSIRKPDRHKFLQEAMINRWSFKELVAAKQTQFGKLEGRGRTPSMPANASDARFTYRRLSQKWHGFHQELADQYENERTTALLAKFSETEREAVTNADAALERVIKLLQKKFPAGKR